MVITLADVFQVGRQIAGHHVPATRLYTEVAVVYLAISPSCPSCSPAWSGRPTAT
ncbi:hypothetical protein QJS66_15345 [Kocuria rhizophila]|nr:hypothetical protein QJS66_15345 [Kocuria rhizophila]